MSGNSKSNSVSSLRHDRAKILNNGLWRPYLKEHIQITFIHMITDQSVSCCYEFKITDVFSLWQAVFKMRPIWNSSEKLTRTTSVFESILCFRNQKNTKIRHLTERKSILQKSYLNSRNHNSINKILRQLIQCLFRSSINPNNA